EDGLEEVVQAAPQREHGLADVDELCGLGADAVHAEEPPGFAVEDHLEQSRVVAEDLPARDLAKARDPRLVRHLVARELLLGGAAQRALGDGVHADGKVGFHRLGVEAEHVRRREIVGLPERTRPDRRPARTGVRYPYLAASLNRAACTRR